MIRQATTQDAGAICEIYNHYIETSIITFEEELLNKEDMTQRIAEVSSAFPWLVYEVCDQILGYAYASKWNERSAYRYSAQSTIYLRPSAQGKGVGKILYGDLFDRLRNENLHCVMAGIALPNEKSVGIHERFGFEKVAHYKEVGWKFNSWIDVGYWQLLLK